MKKLTQLTALLLAMAMMFSLASCGGSDSTENAENTAATDTATEETAPAENADETPAAEAEQTVVDNSEPVYGGNMTMYYHEFYNYYDPAMPTSYSYAFWLEGLWALDWSSDYAYDTDYWTYENVAGQIADSWEISDDYSTLTVKLRDDVFFQDKEPFNGRKLVAEDVKYTYDRLLGLGSGWDEPVECEMNWTRELYMVESVETEGEDTVIIHFTTSTEVALNTFMTTVVNITGAEWDDCPQTWEYACGTGPYVLTEVAVGTSMTFEKNENYYDYDERYPENKLPYLDSITLLHIDDASNTLAQFISGELDWIGSTSSVLNTSEVAQLNASMEEGSYSQYTYTTMPPSEISLKCNQEPFSDVRVRTALQMAININEIHNGYFQLEGDPIVPGIWATSLAEFTTVNDWSDELRAQYTYDPEGAKALLAEAGYPDGFEFTVALAPNANTELYVLVQTYLAQIGVTMNIESCAEIMEAIAIGTDANDTRQVSGSHGGKGVFAMVKMTTTPDGANYVYQHGNEAYLEAVANFEAATTLDEQAVFAKQMDEIYAEEHWGISLGGYTTQNEFMSGRIHGYSGQKLTVNQYRRTVVARLWADAE